MLIAVSAAATDSPVLRKLVHDAVKSNVDTFSKRLKALGKGA